MENNSKKPFEQMHGGVNFSGPVKAADTWLLDKKYYKLTRDRGFDNIRVPINFSAFVLENDPDYTMDPECFKIFDTIVNNALESDLKVVLDFHGGATYNNNPDMFVRIWEQLAEHYKDFDENLMFEIVNEPSGVPDDYLNDVQLRAVAAIRKTNPTRGIALACNQWNGTWKMLSVKWPENDENCFLSVHNYYTMPFTHQAANWGANPEEGDERPGHQPFTQDIANQVREHLEFCYDYQKKFGRTVWISECGVYLGQADMPEVKKYIDHFTKCCADYGLCYAWWEFNVGFGIYDKNKQEWKENIISDMTVQW